MKAKFGFLILVLFTVTSCFKEVAKKKYDLTLTFSSGDVYTFTDIIYEKDKKYIVGGSTDEVMKGYAQNMIVFGNRHLFKTDNKLFGRKV